MKTFLVCVVMAMYPVLLFAAHPCILVSPEDQKAILDKVNRHEWARASFAKLKSRIDPLIEKCEADPQFMSSRLFMHWKTHYTTPLVSNSRWVGGEGKAPIPTPRFAGARDWVTKYATPPELENLKPYNENEQGQVWVKNKETGEENWVDASQTGRMFETTNERILRTASEAAFLYWVTRQERYARYASEILCTYTDGFAYMQPPKMLEGQQSMSKIIGVTSFEVIHEDIVTFIALTYDFLHDYLVAQGKDVRVIQTGLKRMIDRVIAGGGRDGNWNLNQARIITYGGLALESNAFYEDKKGRQYYADIVLNADLPNQRGIAHVLRESLDHETALWAEAAGYGFGSVNDLILLASLLSSDPAGQQMLDDPLLSKAAMAPLQVCYPNGRSNGVGDATNVRVPVTSLELMIANARKRADTSLEAQLTTALKGEIDRGSYDRSKNDSILALTKYVDELAPIQHGTEALVTRTFFHKPLNVFIQRNLADDPEHGLAAALYGTAGGHVHSNGLAIELYGAGTILGADPGRGASYWQPEQGEYYSKPPAHNTVIVNGKTDYPAYGRNSVAMKLESCEPRPLQAPTSQYFSYAQASFEYSNPSVRQNRTLALVRTGPKSGFYFDVFRSRCLTSESENNFHDYLYHNIGQFLQLQDMDGKSLSLGPSEILAEKTYLKGYGYFKNENSVEIPAGFRATFTALIGDTKRTMNVWMPAERHRRIFCVDAPPNRAARDALPPIYSQIPMPTLIVRQSGDAWDLPFVAVYEPSLGTGTIYRVRTIPVDKRGIVACAVEGTTEVDGKTTSFTVYLVQSDDPSATITIEGHLFKGVFSAILLYDGNIIEAYMPTEQKE